MVGRKKKPEKEVRGEIAIIQMEHTEKIVLIQLFLGILLAVLFAITTIFISLFPVETWIMLDAIIYLIAIIVSMLYYFRIVAKMKQKIRDMMKGQAGIVWIIIAILIIVIVLSVLKQIGVI